MASIKKLTVERLQQICRENAENCAVCPLNDFCDENWCDGFRGQRPDEWVVEMMTLGDTVRWHVYPDELPEPDVDRLVTYADGHVGVFDFAQGSTTREIIAWADEIDPYSPLF